MKSEVSLNETSNPFSKLEEHDMTVNDWLTILAILVAPFSALYVMARLQERGELTQRQLRIFKTLMSLGPFLFRLSMCKR